MQPNASLQQTLLNRHQRRKSLLPRRNSPPSRRQLNKRKLLLAAIFCFSLLYLQRLLDFREHIGEVCVFVGFHALLGDFEHGLVAFGFEDFLHSLHGSFVAKEAVGDKEDGFFVGYGGHGVEVGGGFFGWAGSFHGGSQNNEVKLGKRGGLGRG